MNLTSLDTSYDSQESRWETTEMSTDRGVDKDNVVDPYSAILLSFKKEEILQHVTTWVHHEGIVLSEMSQSQEDKCCAFSFKPLATGFCPCSQKTPD